MVAAALNTGVRVYDLKDPFRPEEVANYIPPPHQNSTVGSSQINDVYIDERGIVYGVDREDGGLHIFEMDLP